MNRGRGRVFERGVIGLTLRARPADDGSGVYVVLLGPMHVADLYQDDSKKGWHLAAMGRSAIDGTVHPTISHALMEISTWLKEMPT